MKRLLIMVAALLIAPLAHALTVGDKAPDFSVINSRGQSESLSAYKGKFVVFEWTNSECPFVKKHYDSGNMQALQKRWTDQGVIWFSVVSSAPGKQGHVTPEQANKLTKEREAHPTSVILDSDGKLGHLYDARNTPHLFIVDPNGKLIYQGAIDDKASTNLEDVKGAKNYVHAALTEARAGKAVSMATTKPYGCSVKY